MDANELEKLGCNKIVSKAKNMIVVSSVTKNSLNKMIVLVIRCIECETQFGCNSIKTKEVRLVRLINNKVVKIWRDVENPNLF